MICYLYPKPIFLLFSQDVPSLLYYAQIPATIIALLLGFYIFWNGRKFLLNRLLFLIAVLFSLWTFTTLIVWAGNDGGLFAFVWPFYDLILGLIAIFCIYFIYVFLGKEDITIRIKTVFLVLLAPILILASTNFNVGGFNITNCDAFDFESLLLKTYTSSLGFFAMLWILILLIRKYRVSDSSFKKQIVLMGTGIEFFLFSFFGMEFLATYLVRIGVLPNSQLELYGLFGMVIFMIYISFLVVRFKAFDIKTFGAQVLIFALIILIGSQFFYVTDLQSIIITSITLVVTGVIGINLMRSVKKEVQAREIIEKQEKELETANKGQETLIHIMNHQIKGYLGKAKNIFAELLDSNDYGEMPKESKAILAAGLEETDAGVEYVQSILKGSSATRGTLPYDMKPIDVKIVVSNVLSSQKDVAEKAGLSFESNITDGNYNIVGDETQLGEAFKNLVTNAIKYNNPRGSIKVGLKLDTGKIIFSVKDAGVGISKETEEKLYTLGGMGKDSMKQNVDASGYGLAFVKPVVEKHNGKVWHESNSPEKGTTFFVELPLK